MAKFLLKRLCYMVLVVYIVITATFFLMNTLPGDAFMQQFLKASPETIALYKAKYHLDKPIMTRYFYYLRGLTKLDFGESFVSPGQKVSDTIKSGFPASARYGLQALLLGVTIGIIFGVIAAFNRNTWIDYLIIFIAILGVSVPNFVVALLIQKFFGNSIAITGWETNGAMNFFPEFKYTVLPTIAASFGAIAMYSRNMKTIVTDVMNQDYILTAKAKGLGKMTIIVKHILRNSLIPVVTWLPVTVAGVLCGGFVIERIFGIPGLGQEFVSCISSKDYPMIMGTTIFWCLLYVGALFVSDILYPIVDPRIRLIKGER